MNFRRQPFQFSTIDPAKRQAELQKRFGLPTTNNDMFVDFLNPAMGSGIKEPSLSGSPRLQHRVPLFTGNADKVKSDQNNVDGGHKPRVRVVPIQVEGVDGGKRQRTFSGPAGMVGGRNDFNKGKLQDTFPHLDSTKVDDSLKRPSQPKVCTIPIQIETRDEKPEVVPSSQTHDPVRKVTVESNGCAASSYKEEELEEEPDKTVPLKQIEAVLDKLKVYKEEVEKFSGTSKDKQYRYLDEMLTRCMLDLDNVDTMGLNEIRKARKEAVRQVQQYVDLLDTKVNESVKKVDSDTPNNPVVGQIPCDVPTEANDPSIPDSNDVNIKSASGDVEMSGDIAIDNGNDTKNFNESNDIDDANVVSDVEMREEKDVCVSTPEVTDEKMEVSTQDDLMESEGPLDGKENTFSTEVESCSMPDSDIKDCENRPGIVIEELDDSSENKFNDVCTAGGNETVSCIISDSPEHDVKETITEEGESEVVIEEVEDYSEACENLDGKDLGQSMNTCDCSADSDKKINVEQFNISGDSCDVTDTKFSSGDCAPAVQENIIVSERR